MLPSSVLEERLMSENIDYQLRSPLPSSIPCWLMSNTSASKMKIRATTFLKQAFSLLLTIVKAKSMAVKSKTSTIKTRLLIFSFLCNRRFIMSSITHKLHALMGQEKGAETAWKEEEKHRKVVVLYCNAAMNEESLNTMNMESAELPEKDEEDDYPELRHSLFELEDEDEDNELLNETGSVIDLVRNSKEDGAEFSLEDEIDHVADVFIKRFHRQMRIQKQESFKRYWDMLARGV